MLNYSYYELQSILTIPVINKRFKEILVLIDRLDLMLPVLSWDNKSHLALTVTITNNLLVGNEGPVLRVIQ